MNLIGALFAAVAPTLADLGVRRAPRRSLTVPGERGDQILISPQTVPTGEPDRADFQVTISNHLLPRTAYVRDVSIEEARARPPVYSEGVYDARLTCPSSRSMPEIWTVTPDTLAAVTGDLSAELRRALTTVWLPILPRAELLALIRDTGRKGPSPLGSRRIPELMCRIEDMSEDDLRALVQSYRSGVDPTLHRLAGWIERNLLTASV